MASHYTFESVTDPKILFESNMGSLQLASSKFKNGIHLDIRKYIKLHDVWIPTKKGLALQVDQWILVLPQLIDYMKVVGNLSGQSLGNLETILVERLKTQLDSTNDNIT